MNLYYKMRHLLLIDNSIKDLAVFQGCINSNTDSIVFDFSTETLANLQTKLSAFGLHRQFQHVGIVQENGPSNKFLKLVENQAFVQWIVDKTKCIALDLFMCNGTKDPKWKKTIQMIQTTFPQIALGASTNITGNSASGGDWIAETDGVNLKEIYLTDAIKNYKGTFGIESYHSIIVTESGGCYVVGYNSDGELGLGIEYSFESISPARYLEIPGKTITDVQIGSSHSVFLCSDGSVYACGYGDEYGQLGLGYSTYYVPTEITDLSNITAIACGNDHTLFLHTNGSVYSCGNNEYGGLGLDNNTSNFSTPQLLYQSSFYNNNISAIAAGDRFSIFLDVSGNVYGTGYNYDYGQLGTGDDNDYYGPTPINPNNIFTRPITAIACGQHHTLFLDVSGNLYSAGRNNRGQLGLNAVYNDYYVEPTLISSEYFSSPVIYISCGAYHSFFICSDGTVYACGQNENGELGINNTTNQYSPTPITFFPTNGKTIDYIQAGENHTIFVCNDKSVYGCGQNYNGQIGDGSIINIITPTLFTISNNTISSIALGGDNHTLYLCTDGSLYSFGNNQYGELGLGNTNTVSEVTQNTYFANNSKTVTKIAAHRNNGSSIFLCSDGTVYSCGQGNNGQLGLDNNYNYDSPTQITAFSNIIISDIICGEYHTIFLDSSKNVYTCGYYANGQLGLGNLGSIDYVATHAQITDLSNIDSIGAGHYHTLFLCSNGSVYACGSNGYGQLGTGNFGNDVFTPILITDLSNIIQVSCGENYSLFLCSDGTVYGCGQNGNGQMGLGDTTDAYALTQINELSNIVAIACGWSHSLFLDGSGNVYGCGYNQHAELGLPNSEDQIYIYSSNIVIPTQITIGTNKVVSEIYACGSRSAFLCTDGSLYVCGSNYNNYYNYDTDTSIYYSLFGFSYEPLYTLPNLATFTANPVVCFGEGTEILTILDDQETYVPVEKLRPGAIVKTYKHGPQVLKKIGTGAMYNNSEDPKKCMYKMEKSGNMTADLCLTGGHAILKPHPPKGLQFKIDDQYLHFVENLPEFKKMAPRKYNYYNFCFENGGDYDLRYGVLANGVLCETPSEKQLDSFNQKMLV